MKKSIFFSILSLFIICQAHAQQNNTTRHMTITIVNTHAFMIGKQNNMFITRDDTAQVEKMVDLNPHLKMKDEAAGFENLLMQLIQPYYNQGWKLISTSAEAATEAGTNITTETYRYYFTRE